MHVVLHGDGLVLQVLHHIRRQAADEVAVLSLIRVQQRRSGILRIRLRKDGVVLSEDGGQRLHTQARAVHLAQTTEEEMSCS